MPQIWGKTEPSAQSRGQKDNSGYSCQKVRKRRYQSFLVQSSLTRFPYFVRIISSMVIWTNPFLPLIHPSLLKSYVFWHLVFDITLVIGSFLIEPSFLRQKYFFSETLIITASARSKRNPIRQSLSDYLSFLCIIDSSQIRRNLIFNMKTYYTGWLTSF